jgi:hypothetical protein
MTVTEAAVPSAMTRAQNDFVKLQQDERWRGLPGPQRLAEVREIRHVVQSAAFEALLSVQQRSSGCRNVAGRA